MNINSITTTMGSDVTQGSFFTGGASSQFKMRQEQEPVQNDTVSTSALQWLSDSEAASTLENVMSSIGANRADALSAHSGLDYNRALSLLEGI